MKERNSSAFWRIAAVVLLAVTAIPVFWNRPDNSIKQMTVTPGEVWDVPGEIVVQRRSHGPHSVGQALVSELSTKYGLTFIPVGPSLSSARILQVSTAPELASGLLARLRKDPDVEFAEPQHLVRAFWKPNDPRYKEQWNFQRIHMEKAWDVTKGKGAVVAVIDTGVAFEKDSKCYRARDFDKTQFTDPYDFIFKDKHPTDDHGHGTHVAGTIAESTNNGEGVAGIAFEAKVMPLKVLTKEGYGKMSDIAAAIRYAADHKANVINMSLGGPYPDSISRSACQYALKKGVTIVCAAGNSGSEGVGYPAAYPECIAVSALGPSGEMAPYSSWGSQIAISAPGGDKSKGEDKGILQNTYLRVYDRSSRSTSGVLNSWDIAEGSPQNDISLTWKTDSDPSDVETTDKYEDGYFYFQGTSMASPHVAGVAALVVSRGVKDPAEVKAILQKSAQKRGDRKKYGAGELDAAAAVKLAGATNSEYYGRFWVVGALWAGCMMMGLVRKGRLPVASTLALTLGILIPDAITSLAGFDSMWNLAGHSVLIPGYLLISEAESRSERCFLGLLALGLVAHLGWDLWMGTAPFTGVISDAVLPWLWANVVVGAGAFVAGLRR